jgi:(E)-2-((N-methylformamido)methylene)succinate hydrolase
VLNATRAEGDGPPVVLLHGVFMDHTLWDAVAAALPNRHVVALDMPGHGASPALTADDTIDDHVRQVAATLDQLDLGPAVIVGHSWGGMVGLRLAQRRPDLVGGLVMTNTPLLRPRGATRLGFVFQRSIIALGFPLGAYAAAAARSLYGRDHLDHHPQTAAALAVRLRQLGRTGIRRTIRSVILDPEDTVGDVARLTVPYRILGGEHDYAVSTAVRGRLRAIGANPVITPGGHTGPAEAPLPVAKSIRQVISAMG